MLWKRLIWYSILLYIAANILPAVQFEKINCSATPAGLWQGSVGTVYDSTGSDLFVGGAIAFIFFGMIFIIVGAWGWLANLLYFYSLVLAAKGVAGRARKIKIAMGFAIFLAFISLPLTNISPLPHDEAGISCGSAIAPLLGFWLWLGSFVALFAAAHLQRVEGQQK